MIETCVGPLELEKILLQNGYVENIKLGTQKWSH
jgi:hypothetical protein